jgi:hypothetical protein
MQMENYPSSLRKPIVQVESLRSENQSPIVGATRNFCSQYEPDQALPSKNSTNTIRTVFTGESSRSPGTTKTQKTHYRTRSCAPFRHSIPFGDNLTC